ncbi:hypothetical protein GCM10010275_53980 [Streptomyces litmocidini]|nr:hypothetical protein GCM10010275_53980 [Streptomyces litmocidini]
MAVPEFASVAAVRRPVAALKAAIRRAARFMDPSAWGDLRKGILAGSGPGVDSWGDGPTLMGMLVDQGWARKGDPSPLSIAAAGARRESCTAAGVRRGSGDADQRLWWVDMCGEAPCRVLGGLRKPAAIRRGAESRKSPTNAVTPLSDLPSCRSERGVKTVLPGVVRCPGKDSRVP